jgi:hypothetical protein
MATLAQNITKLESFPNPVPSGAALHDQMHTAAHESIRQLKTVTDGKLSNTDNVPPALLPQNYLEGFTGTGTTNDKIKPIIDLIPTLNSPNLVPSGVLYAILTQMGWDGTINTSGSAVEPPFVAPARASLGDNLFWREDPDMMDGKAIGDQEGYEFIYDNGGFKLSGFVKVYPGELFTTTQGISFLNWYNADKSFKAHMKPVQGNRHTPPAGAEYMRFSTSASSYNNMYIFLGDYGPENAINRSFPFPTYWARPQVPNTNF